MSSETVVSTLETTRPKTKLMSTIENLEKITGFKRAEMDAIFQEVKANQKRLKECVRPHDFSICLDRRTKEPIPNPTPQQLFGAKWKCTLCGGIVDGLEKRTYLEGLNDGSKL